MLILSYIIQIYYLNMLIIEKKPKSTGAEKIMKVKKSIYKQRCSQLSRLCPFPRGSPVCSGCRRQPPWEGTHLFPAQVALRGLGDNSFQSAFMTGLLSPVCSWVGRIPWRRKWQPSPEPLPGESHGQRSLVGYSPWGRKESDTTEKLHFHFHKQCCYCSVNLSQHVDKQSIKLTTEFNILGKFHY